MEVWRKAAGGKGVEPKALAEKFSGGPTKKKTEK